MPVRNVAVTERLRFDLDRNRVAENIETPFQILIAGQDQLVSPEGAYRFIEQCTGVADK